jgi:hypothetical protein
MIAETMLPEAYFKGCSVVGLSTLFGFLVAIYSKTLEPNDAGGAFEVPKHGQTPVTETTAGAGMPAPPAINRPIVTSELRD